MTKKIVLAGACRTAIGKMGGELSTVPAVDLGAAVIKEAVKRAGLKPEQIDHVYMGNVIQAGLGQNPARQASIKAGLPVTCPAVTVNVVCGSGLDCVNMAAEMILAGDADIVVAGGMESMSNGPYLLPHARFGYRMKLVTYTTTSANMMLREIGLVLFLASVGVKAGAGFWETVIAGDGLKYVYTGFLITIIPILIVGVVARLRYKFDYFTIMGMLAGTYTDPPALAYANASCSREAPAVGYSTVYPLSMFLRIFTAQLIVLFCCGA